MTSPEAVRSSSYDQLFEVASTDGNEDASFLKWEAELTDKTKPWQAKMAADANNETNVEQENLPTDAVTMKARLPEKWSPP